VAQLKVDIICKRLQESQAIKLLSLEFCFLPQQDAFRELCKSPTIDHLTLHNVFEGDVVLENELYRFSGLKTIAFEYCSCNTVKAGLSGLFEHPALDRIFIRGLGGSSFLDVFPALDRLLESRERKVSRLCFELGSHVEINNFLDVIVRHDALKELDLSTATVNKNAAAKLQVFLKASHGLQVLKLPQTRTDSQYGNEGLVMILEGVQKSNSLSELSINTTAPETIFLMLKGNVTLRVLELYGTHEDDLDSDYDFEELKHLHGLQHLDVSRLLAWSFRSIDRHSLIAALKVNATLQEIIWGQGFQELAFDPEINFYLRLNRWFNRHGPDILRTPERFSEGLWPYIFERVSSNTNALHALVCGYPRFNN